MKNLKGLLDEYLKENHEKKAQMIKFEGVDGYDVYNITSPFKSLGRTVIAGRVEKRDSEFSKICFFSENENGIFEKIKDIKTYDLQDPFYTFIGGELILGGVEVRLKEGSTSEMQWKTVFYKGHDISSLEKFFEGPEGMKDLRIAELKDGRIIVLTRPQGEKGGRGKVGYTIVDTLKDLSIKVIEDAPLLNLFIDEEWGGANEIHVLSDDIVGILGHIASFDEEGNRHYCSMVIKINIKTLEYTNPKLIAIRNEFLESDYKRKDLIDVVFSGGLIRKEDGTATLYAGISDANAQKITIQDPFM